jgi:hypothetical protein
VSLRLVRWSAGESAARVPWQVPVFRALRLRLAGPPRCTVSQLTPGIGPELLRTLRLLRIMRLEVVE